MGNLEALASTFLDTHLLVQLEIRTGEYSLSYREYIMEHTSVSTLSDPYPRVSRTLSILYHMPLSILFGTVSGPHP